LFVPCGELSWLPVSFLLHVKHTLSYRIVSYSSAYSIQILRGFISSLPLPPTALSPPHICQNTSKQVFGRAADEELTALPNPLSEFPWVERDGVEQEKGKGGKRRERGWMGRSGKGRRREQEKGRAEEK